MNRQHAIIISLLLLCTALNANDLSDRGLKGRVKRFGSGRFYQGTLFTRTITIFDKSGNITAVHTFNKAGKTGKQLLTRDSSGKLLHVRHLSNGGNLLRKITYTYKNGSRPVASVIYNPDGSVMQTVSFAYTASGRTLRMIGFSPGQKKMFEIHYRYDANGRLNKSRHLNHGSGLYYILAYEYKKFDAEGNWTRRIRKTISLQNRELGIEIEKRAFEYYK